MSQRPPVDPGRAYSYLYLTDMLQMLYHLTCTRGSFRQTQLIGNTRHCDTFKRLLCDDVKCSAFQRGIARHGLWVAEAPKRKRNPQYTN